MNKQESQAIAAVICRVVDYYFCRAAMEKAAESGRAAPDAIVNRLEKAEGYLAKAIESTEPEDESGEPHQVG